MRNALTTFNELAKAIVITFPLVVMTYILTFNTGELTSFSTIKPFVLFFVVAFALLYLPLLFLRAIIFEKRPKKNSQLIVPLVVFGTTLAVALFFSGAIKNFIVQTQEIYPASYEGAIAAVEVKDFLLFGPSDFSKYFVYSDMNSGYPNRYGIRFTLSTGEQFHLVFFYENERDELLRQLEHYVNESVIVSAFPESKKVLHIFPSNNSNPAIFAEDIEKMIN